MLHVVIEQAKKDGTKGTYIMGYEVIPANLRKYECIKIPGTRNEWEYLRETNEIITPEGII